MKKFALLLLPLMFWGCTQGENLETSALSDTGTQQTIDENSTLEDFAGKPSLIIFGGVYCPHCRSAMPKYEEEIWNVYQGQANIWINVIDQKKFDVDNIPQGFNPNLDHTKLTGTPCGYVPSWVMLNENLQVVDQQCGGSDIQKVTSKLDELLSQ